ncbi:MAG: sigma-54 dependent transcriptional regulator [Chitinispirillales bacterium]|jgi:two-component system response regulator AtoC|nr:sigma-54 dependent transcriptional regulator [Chitinispirillales bacterium]
MEKRNILVVDDKDFMRESISEVLRRKGYDVKTASGGHEAMEIFKRESFDLVISDYKMPQMNGVELLQSVKAVNADVPFLIFTGFGEIKIAVEAMQKGAFTFLEKDDSLLQKIEVTVDGALEKRSLIVENKMLNTENETLKNELRDRWNYVGCAPKLQEIRQFTQSVAGSRSTVLITGESGTGKELIARWIHYHSPRQLGPFVKINCAALPEHLIESELFGHEKGAFTGAIKDKTGKFEAANRGTLLLDEISEMPMSAQAKLLRAIQEKEIQKVGGDDPLKVDVRILATSNRDLLAEMDKGNFREDLYYRLNIFHVELPPLRERKEDIVALVEHFIGKFNDENDLSVSGLEEGCKKLLCAYNWPGNIRELENKVERAVVLTCTGLIKPTAFDLTTDGARARSSGRGLEAGMTIDEAEKELIIKTLEHCGNKKNEAAKMLGISVRTLRNKLNQYALGTDDDVDDD